MRKSIEMEQAKQTIKQKGGELYVGSRLFDPYHSKLAAAVMNNVMSKRKIPLKKTDVVLYLGASHGYTASFIAELCAFVFAVEVSSYVVPQLIDVCKRLKNIAPMLADASKPLSYFRQISGVDIVYQDIAQKNQVEIFIKNIGLYLKKGGYGMLAVKCRSIDVAAEPSEVFKQVKSGLEKHLKIIGSCTLEPYEKDHYFIIVKNMLKKW